MNNTSSDQGQVWKRCPQGMLRQVADRNLKRNRHNGPIQFDRRQMLQIAAAVAVTAGAGTIAYQSLFPRVNSMGLGGVTCSKFLSNLQKYIDKGLEDQELVASMDKHLKLCKPCRVIYERKRNA